MAKKEAKEMSVEQKLQALYELQTTLTAIDEKRALRGELPLEVQDLEDEIAGLDTRIEKIDTEIKEFQSAITMKTGGKNIWDGRTQNYVLYRYFLCV